MQYEKAGNTLKIKEKQLTKKKKYGIYINIIFWNLDHNKKGEEMLDEKICLLREKLNDSIINGEDYSIIYQLSIELDELIAKYYIQTKMATK